MPAKFYIEEATPWQGGVLVNGYVEGVIPVGLTFTCAKKYMEMRDGKCIKLEEPLEARPVSLKVVKAVAFNQVLTELNSLSGSLLLSGMGESAIGWGDMLSD